ncbi:hypothetical protein [Oribacterium sp. FC2011]|uniref:hypothetical protein n=1 Tax=Oribacterium sp. FC2011 TaxID=1408311 RepID=UPI0004E23066|nr:hypothetical protein [Oribacterium sp. FC2011]
MNVFSLINSKDIRQYLHKINYEFNSLETAWLIYQCHSLSYEEKRAMWQELIQTMPDCTLPQRSYETETKSLHESIRQYIEVFDQKIQIFLNDEPDHKNVYMYSYRYGSYEKECTEDYYAIFPSLELCLADFQEESEDGDEVLSFKIKKQSLDNPYHYIEVTYRIDGQILDIYENPDEHNPIPNFFEELYLEFPTPFEKGDILWIPNCKGVFDRYCDERFVLKHLCTWDSPDVDKTYRDNTDMNGIVYMAFPNYGIDYDHPYNYMDYEFYREPLKPEEDFLKVLSNYMKGKFDVEVLLRVFRKKYLEQVLAKDTTISWWDYSTQVIERE